MRKAVGAFWVLHAEGFKIYMKITVCMILFGVVLPGSLFAGGATKSAVPAVSGKYEIGFLEDWCLRYVENEKEIETYTPRVRFGFKFENGEWSAGSDSDLHISRSWRLSKNEKTFDVIVSTGMDHYFNLSDKGAQKVLTSPLPKFALLPRNNEFSGEIGWTRIGSGLES